MGFIEKQSRNGSDVGVGTHNSAQPGPDITGDVSGLMSQSEAAANDRKTAGATLVAGNSVPASGLMAGGDMWEWDSGLAVGEQPGEA